MPSHRSTNFSRLKELLPSLPPARAEQDETNAPEIPAEDASSDLRSKQVAEIRGTAAVQQAQPDPVRSSLSAKPGKVKPLTRPSTFRLAIELQEALKAVAEYNRLNMTDIVAEGIWLHLQNFDWPPGSKQLRETINSLF